MTSPLEWPDDLVLQHGLVSWRDINSVEQGGSDKHSQCLLDCHCKNSSDSSWVQLHCLLSQLTLPPCAQMVPPSSTQNSTFNEHCCLKVIQRHHDNCLLNFVEHCVMTCYTLCFHRWQLLPAFVRERISLLMDNGHHWYCWVCMLFIEVPPEIFCVVQVWWLWWPFLNLLIWATMSRSAVPHAQHTQCLWCTN